MTQKERRVFLINYLKTKKNLSKEIVIPHDTEAQKTSPSRFDERASAHACLKDFTDIQDEYLQQENRQRGIVSLVIYLRNSRRSISGKGILPAFLLMQS